MVRHYLASYWYWIHLLGSNGVGNCDVEVTGTLTIAAVKDIESKLAQRNNWERVIIIAMTPLEG